jgi:hypothetical protein
VSSLEEDWVFTELVQAREENKPVLPVLIAGATMPRPDELPDELSWVPQCQSVTIREGEPFDRDMDSLFLKLERDYHFKPLRGYPWAAMLVLLQGAFFVGIFAGAIGLARVLDLEILTTVPLALFVCVLGAVLWNLFSLLTGRDQRATTGRGVRLVQAAVLGIVTLITCASLTALWTSLFLGTPVDMRDRLNPKIIRRSGQPQFAGLRLPVPIDRAFPSPANSGQGEKAETQGSMAKFKRWIVDGSQPQGSNARVYVYRFEPEKADYYRSFDATIRFPKLGEGAQLAQGAAFLVRNADNPTEWRQVALWVSDKNLRHLPPEPMLANKLRDVQIDAGDTLLIILKFFGTPGTEADWRKLKLEQFEASLAPIDE